MHIDLKVRAIAVGATCICSLLPAISVASSASISVRTENSSSSHNSVHRELLSAPGIGASGRAVFQLLSPASISPARPKPAAAIAPASISASHQNLVPNPSLEQQNGDAPAQWRKGGYGNNTRILTYPTTPAEDGSAAATVQITSYTSGDAKWYFSPISIDAGKTYEFSDWSHATVPTEIDVQLTMSDGSHSYIVLAKPAASSAYQQTTAQFTAPAGSVSATVFHVIDRVGSLTVDNYSLSELTTSADNLIQNGDFETGGANGQPANWNKGGWGQNSVTYTYPATGPDGSRAAQVSITSYQSGDQDWYFTPLSLSPGVYAYSNDYSSNVPSIVELQLLNADGSYTYKDLSLLSATRGFAHESIDFTVPDGTKNVTVYHLVQQVGTLTIDNASLVKKAEFTGVFTTGAVSLRFDDGWQSQWDNAIPAMQADGLKGTFYIVSQQIADNDYSGFMSKAEIAQMAQMGEEIGAHTRTHPDLTTLTPAQQREEIDGSRQDLLSWNVGPIRSFAYPYGAYSTTTIQIVKDAGFENAAATISGDVTPTSDPYQLEDEEVQDTTSLAQVKAWIDDAATKKLWLVLTFHRVDQNCDTYCTSPQEFREIADYLKQKGIPVVTVSEGLQSMQ